MKEITAMGRNELVAELKRLRVRVERTGAVVEAARKTNGCRARLAAMYSPRPPIDHGRTECGACDVCRLAEALHAFDTSEASNDD